jgi:two-component system NtrC family sensor kinase
MTLSPPPWDLIAEWIPHAVWVIDNEGSTQYFNRRGHDLVGITADEASGLGWLRVVHPDDTFRARGAWQTALRDGTPYEAEYRVRTIGGDYRWVVARALPVRGVDEAVLLWAGTWTDIDDIKSPERTLGGTNGGSAASLAFLDALQATLPLGIGLVDRDFRIVHMNDLLAGHNGTSPEEAEGRTLAEVLGSVWLRDRHHYQRVLDTGNGVADVTVAGPGTDGLPSYWLTSYFPVASGGEIQGVGVVMTDMSERKREEEFHSVLMENILIDVSERKREEEFHSVVMENIAEGLYALDARGRVTYVNAAASRMLGWDPEQLIGKPMHETIHFQKEDGTPLPVSECPVINVSTTGETISLASDAFTRKDGSIFPVSLSSAPLPIGDAIGGLVVVFRDITDERTELGRTPRDQAALSWLGRIRRRAR